MPMQSNAVSLAVTIFLSGQAGGELRLFKKVSQSIRRITNLQVGGNFIIFYFIFALECFCVLLLQIWHVCH